MDNNSKRKIAQTDNFLTFGKRIKAVRKGLGVSQAMFARSLGISKTTYIRYEHDKRDIPAKDLAEIARMDRSLDEGWLLTGAGEAGRKAGTDEDLLTVVLAHGRAVDKYLEDIHRLELKNAELEGGLKNLAQDEKTTAGNP